MLNAPAFSKKFIVVAGLILLPAQVLSAPISTANFDALAQSCAPSIALATLSAVAKVESGFDPWALHDNTTGQNQHVSSLEQAEVQASQWISHDDSVDIGMMQINSANLSALNLTAVQALDPCASLAAGAEILRAAYGGDNTPITQQVALLMALSRYNTGSPLRGIMNGYARKVMMSMTNVGGPVPQTLAMNSAVDAVSDPNTPPPWNVAAAGSYEEVHGAPWLISLPPTVQQESSVR
ncbi:transglycosylase SLT domain-containing protein [Acidocella sp.]|uniref:transglycosylase SLT domain-containing protein n=1 Tax=Acidocella sp. TaxID=50710 RepID=UPI003CFBF848